MSAAQRFRHLFKHTEPSAPSTPDARLVWTLLEHDVEGRVIHEECHHIKVLGSGGGGQVHSPILPLDT